VKPGGFLIISCPNFTNTQYWLHYLLDKENLFAHEIPAMDLKKWETVLQEHGMGLLYHDYYKTAGFWVEDQKRNTVQNLVGKGITHFFSLLDKLINLPNAHLSPHMISISKKRELV